MKGCIVFLVLVGSLAAAADLKVTITNARGTPLNANAPAVSAIDFDSDLSVDTGFTQQTIYTSGSNQRIEFAAMPGVFLHELAGLNHGGSYPLDLPHMAVITHCDSGIIDELDLDDHEYREFKMPQYLGEKKFMELLGRAQKTLKNSLQASTVDTGERRVFFGQTARHLITTVNETRNAFHSDGNSKLLKVQVKEKVVTVVDGWYLDQPQPGCAPEYLRRNLGQAVTAQGAADFLDVQPDRNRLNEPQLPKWGGYYAYSPGQLVAIAHAFPYGLREATWVESPEYVPENRLVYTGYMPSGLAVEQQITMTGTLPATRAFPEEKLQGQPLGLKVTEFSDAPLDPALFNVPPDFKKVKELYQRNGDGTWMKTKVH